MQLQFHFSCSMIQDSTLPAGSMQVRFPKKPTDEDTTVKSFSLLLQNIQFDFIFFFAQPVDLLFQFVDLPARIRQKECSPRLPKSCCVSFNMILLSVAKKQVFLCTNSKTDDFIEIDLAEVYMSVQRVFPVRNVIF